MSEPTPADGAAQDADPTDDLATPYKRRIALSVAVLVFIGGLLGLAATNATIEQAQASRSAQTQSVQAFAQGSINDAELYEEYRNYIDARLLRRRHDLAAVSAELLGTRANHVPPEVWEEQEAVVEDVSTALQPGALLDRPDLLQARLAVASNLPYLRQQAEQAKAGEWGRKGDRFIGGVTMVAVAGSLLGLSLTVPGGSRWPLVLAAILISSIAVIGGLVIVADPVRGTRDQAIIDVAAGDRLFAERDYSAAIDAYTRAISEDGDYATAYSKRSLARVIGSDPSNSGQYVVNSATENAYVSALADVRHAIDLGETTFLNLANAGAFYYHVGDFHNSAEYSQRAIDTNPGLSLPWANLGLARAALGESGAAKDAYRVGIALINKRPDSIEQQEFFASSRGYLAALEDQPNRSALAIEIEGMLVSAEEAQRPPEGASSATAQIGSLDLSVNGSGLTAAAAYEGPDDAALDWIVYFRHDPSDIWLERQGMSTFALAAPDDAGTVSWYRFDNTCPDAGEYRLDVYSGERRLATATVSLGETDRKPGQLELLYDTVGRMGVCLPEPWKLTHSAWGSMDLAMPETGETIEMRTLPLASPPTSDAGRKRLEAEVLSRLVASMSPRADRFRTPDVPATLVGPASVRWVRLPAQRSGEVLVSVSADGILRTLTAVYGGEPGTSPPIFSRISFY